MDLGKDIFNSHEINNLELIKKKEENLGDKNYEKAYRTFLSKTLNDNTKDNFKNIYPIKLTRSDNIVK